MKRKIFTQYVRHRDGIWEHETIVHGLGCVEAVIRARDQVNIAGYLLIVVLIAKGLYKDAEEVQTWIYDIQECTASAISFYKTGKLDFHAKYDLGVQDYCDCGRKVK